jgi:hypothetical protein
MILPEELVVQRLDLTVAAPQSAVADNCSKKSAALKKKATL